MTAPTASGMPMLGFGTWENDDHEQCATSVETALETGYRHIDTAQAYGNEAAVGDGIAAADVDRDDIFLATKIWISNLTHDDVLETLQESLDRLGTEYLDLLYIHWPARAYDPAETLAAFDQLYDEGTIKNVGVSNFEPHHIEEAKDHLDAPVFANQVEIHPYLQQEELREYAAENEIELVAYSPLARAEILSDPTLGEIAEDHDASIPQVSLAWLRQQEITAIPKATSEAHIRDNWGSLQLELTDEDCERIEEIGRVERQVNPDFGPDAWD